MPRYVVCFYGYAQEIKKFSLTGNQFFLWDFTIVGSNVWDSDGLKRCMDSDFLVVFAPGS